MNNNSIQIELNNHPYQKDVYYVSIGLRGGYVVSDYILNEKEHFASNRAFFNVLFNYYGLSNSALGLKFDVQRAASTISFSRKRTELLQTIKEILQIIFDHDYNRDMFDQAKLAAKEAFATRYKEGAFRALYKAYEFSDLNKRFTLKSLISDIEHIDFNIFKECAKALLVPGNVCMYIVGNTSNLNLNNLALSKSDLADSHSVRIAGFNYDPLLRQDAHITSIARDDHCTIIEAFDFLNPNITNLAKLLIVEILAEHIQTHYADIWVDSLDASVIFSSEQVRSYKNNCFDCTEKSYIAAQKGLLGKYISLLEKNPEHFAIKAASQMTIGVYVDQYLSFLSQCTYEMFKEVCVTADYKISEAQIVLRKES